MKISKTEQKDRNITTKAERCPFNIILESL